MPKFTSERYEKQKLAILDGCMRCFARKGFHSTSLRALCEFQSLSVGALYGYFDSKEAIIKGIIDLDRARWEAAVAKIPPAMPFSEVIATLGSIAEHGCANRDELAMFLQIAAEATTNPEIALVLKKYYAVLTQRIETLISFAIERGEIDRSIQPHEGAVFMIACVDGLIARMACDPGSLTGDPGERVDTRVLQVIYQVVAPTKTLFVGQQMDLLVEGHPRAAHNSKRFKK